MKKKKEFAVIESMFTGQVSNQDSHEMLVVRVWRDEEEVREHYDNSDLEQCLEDNRDKKRHDIARAVAAMPRVNAVEVKELGSGMGVLIYREWP